MNGVCLWRCFAMCLIWFCANNRFTQSIIGWRESIDWFEICGFVSWQWLVIWWMVMNWFFIDYSIESFWNGSLWLIWISLFVLGLFSYYFPNEFKTWFSLLLVLNYFHKYRLRYGTDIIFENFTTQAGHVRFSFRNAILFNLFEFECCSCSQVCIWCCCFAFTSCPLLTFRWKTPFHWKVQSLNAWLLDQLNIHNVQLHSRKTWLSEMRFSWAKIEDARFATWHLRTPCPIEVTGAKPK